MLFSKRILIDLTRKQVKLITLHCIAAINYSIAEPCFEFAPLIVVNNSFNLILISLNTIHMQTYTNKDEVHGL